MRSPRTHAATGTRARCRSRMSHAYPPGFATSPARRAGMQQRSMGGNRSTVTRAQSPPHEARRPYRVYRNDLMQQNGEISKIQRSR
jgi:hypothetical protein